MPVDAGFVNGSRRLLVKGLCGWPVLIQATFAERALLILLSEHPAYTDIFAISVPSFKRP